MSAALPPPPDALTQLRLDIAALLGWSDIVWETTWEHHDWYWTYCGIPPACSHHRMELPDWPKDVAVAMQALEGRHQSWALIRNEDDPYDCECILSTGREVGHGDQPAEAICRALLAASRVHSSLPSTPPAVVQ